LILFRLIVQLEAIGDRVEVDDIAVMEFHHIVDAQFVPVDIGAAGTALILEVEFAVIFFNYRGV